MRVTDSLKTNSLLQNIEAGLTNMNTVQNQIATGKKLNTPSDDPAGTSQSLALRQSLAANAQYQTDANAAKSFLSATDSALSDAGNIIQSARQIAVEGANATQTPDSLNALASQVDSLIQQMTNIANNSFNGKYLFGGTKTTTAPFDSTQTYHGDEGAVQATIGPSNTMTLNTPGDHVFTAVFQALAALKTSLTGGNPATISTGIGGFDTALSTVSTARANIGAKVNEVTSVAQNLTRAQGQYQDAISNIEDVDLAQAYVQLQSDQNVYQASLVTTAKAYQHSLADYL